MDSWLSFTCESKLSVHLKEDCASCTEFRLLGNYPPALSYGTKEQAYEAHRQIVDKLNLWAPEFVCSYVLSLTITRPSVSGNYITYYAPSRVILGDLSWRSSLLQQASNSQLQSGG